MADQNDLTTNVALYQEGKTVSVTTETDGSKERLHVDTNISGGVIVQKFSTQGEAEVDTAVTLNTSTDVTLLEITAEGKLDFVAVNSATSSNFEIAIVIDGVERFRLSMAGLNTLGLTTPDNVPLWADTAGKNFRYHPNEGDDFATSFKILAKATVATPSVFWAVKYREAIQA